jgi:hypothetical protein
VVDLSEFHQAIRAPGPDCSVNRLIALLSEDQAAKLDAAFADQNIPGTAIATVLSGWVGQKVAVPTLRRHRNKECGCG